MKVLKTTIRGSCIDLASRNEDVTVASEYITKLNTGWLAVLNTCLNTFTECGFSKAAQHPCYGTFSLGLSHKTHHCRTACTN